ncbi:hypothetical protein LR48_Vigan11g140200 [Vigna angularis]|uniref:Uncharacterized protein n=1 Tax=Phaseolus angularis TaxID=3914 RepID=A0A0L9VTV4_PHAAN|nr:hypothetical protein LR48_Vigan11g140200 [Vigna angularis]
MRLSHVRSEHESAPTPDDASNADDDIRRTQCWIDIVGGKKKGRVYDAGQLAANYTTSRGGTLKHQPSSTSTPDEVLQLRQELHQRDQEITDLRAEFTNFKAMVMRVLPQTSQDEQNIPPTQSRPSSSPATTQQPTSVQPSSVQPTPVQPSVEEQDDEDHSDDIYVWVAKKNHFSETCSAFYRRLLPFGKCPQQVITEGFCPSVWVAKKNHFSETCSAFYRRLLPFGKCPQQVITEGFCPSVNTLEWPLPRAFALRFRRWVTASISNTVSRFIDLNGLIGSDGGWWW